MYSQKKKEAKKKSSNSNKLYKKQIKNKSKGVAGQTKLQLISICHLFMAGRNSHQLLFVTFNIINFIELQLRGWTLKMSSPSPNPVRQTVKELFFSLKSVGTVSCKAYRS